MKTLRYLGPLAGVELSVNGSPVDVALGATVDVPDELADGSPHEFHDGYEPEEVDGQEVIDPDMIRVPGTGGLLEQTYFDADDAVQPCWTVVKAPKGSKDDNKSKSDPPPAE